MKSHYRDILKHSGVYGLGQVLSRLASVLMLPLYTHYLRPADYGTIAILDLTAGVVGIIIGGGMVSARSAGITSTWRRCAMIVSYVVCERVTDGIGVSRVAGLVVPAVVWLGWAAALLRPMLKAQFFPPKPATAS